MDAGDIIYFIILAAGILGSLFSKSKKKRGTASRPSSKESQNTSWETILKELSGEETQETVKEKTQNTYTNTIQGTTGKEQEEQKQYRSYDDEFENTEEFKEEKTTPISEQPVIEESKNYEEEYGQKQKIDLRQAIIYSAIMNRPRY